MPALKDGTFGKAKGGMLNRGWTLVGEEGMELIGPDGRVYPHEESKRMMARGMNNVTGLAGGSLSFPPPPGYGGGGLPPHSDPPSPSGRPNPVNYHPNTAVTAGSGGGQASNPTSSGAASAAATAASNAAQEATQAARETQKSTQNVAKSIAEQTQTAASNLSVSQQMLDQLVKLNEALPAAIMQMTTEVKKAMA
jgi:hypothetical protein